MKKRGPRWSSRERASRPKLVVVGVGRTGGALAFRLKAARWPVAVLPRSSASRERARALNLRLANPELLHAAELCVLAVPDGQLALATDAVLPSLSPKAALVHCAGALSLDAFGHPERRRGSLHPLVAISHPKDALEGAYVAVAASDEALKAVLWRMASSLRTHPLEVPEGQRAAYHAGAVMSAGLMLTLLDAAVEATGLSRQELEPALLALARSALAGAGARGLKDALTGPVVRGDAQVVRAHLKAVPEALAPLYRALSRRALELSGKGLSATARAEVAQALDLEGSPS